MAIAACGGGGHTVAGPSSGCGSALSFTVLPVPITSISAATPVGNMGPPIHTIPTDHSGVYLAGTGVTLVSPGPLRVTVVTRVHYLVSPFRQGVFDYAITANACNGYQVVLGHILTVVDKISSQVGSDCTTYSTANETVESCRNFSADIALNPGETIGTVGSTSEPAFDFGLYNAASPNSFVNPARYSSNTLSATCAYDAFTSDLRAQLYAKIGQPGLPGSGESPACGTMNVDVVGTARGVWVLQSAPVNQAGDETNFAALTPHPFYQQSGQAISIGLATLINSASAPLARFPVTTSGRVNRQFRDVTADGQIYCYVPDLTLSNFSYYLRLGSGNVLTIQHLNHSPGASPCSRDPSTWAFDGTAVAFIR